VLVFIGWQVSNHAKATDAKVQAMASEFCVGHPSRDFLAKGRSIGAFDYSVTPNPSPDKKPGPPVYDPDWNVDSMEPAGEEVYRKKLAQLEEKFQRLPDGKASVMLMVIPPFGREGCEIKFMQGKVTGVRVLTLD
jgi:hypothetical protein